MLTSMRTLSVMSTAVGWRGLQCRLWLAAAEQACLTSRPHGAPQVFNNWYSYYIQHGFSAAAAAAAGGAASWAQHAGACRP